MKLNPIFSDNMVLQANKPIRIFGVGCGRVSAEIDGISSEGCFEGGEFLLEMPSHDYGGPFSLKVGLDGEQVVFSDVYFGDVILMAGQSNAQHKLSSTDTPREEYESEDMLRLFTLERIEKGEKGDFFFPEDGWVKANADSVGLWSALGYLSGKLYQRATERAVGVIACYQGASMIQSWIPEGILDGTELELSSERQSGHMRNPDHMRWNHDGQLYEFMFRKLLPYSIKAVVWYQGESNTSAPDNTVEIYRGLLSVLIRRWREDLMDAGLPFVVVQIADFVWAKQGWAEVQQAQAEIGECVENTVTVVSRDICESADIHPKNKAVLAMRIADAL